MGSKKKTKIFIAHSIEDIADARIVRNIFENLHHDPLLLKLSQEMTDRYLRKLLKKEIKAHDWLVVINSKNSLRSDWVGFEENYARKAEKSVYYIELEECSNLSGKKKEHCLAVQVSHISRAIRVFMIYEQGDRKMAQRITDDLKKRGFEVWLDMEQLRFDVSVEKQISDAFYDTLKRGSLVVLVSRTAIESPRVLADFNYALSQKGSVIPCLVEYLHSADLPPELMKIQWIDFTLSYERALQELFSALRLPKHIPKY